MAADNPVRLVADLMDADPLVVGPDTTVKELAAQLLGRGVDGACVVHEGTLVGVVTSGLVTRVIEP